MFATGADANRGTSEHLSTANSLTGRRTDKEGGREGGRGESTIFEPDSNTQPQSETVRDGQGLSETVRNSQKQSGTVRDSQGVGR